MPHPKPPAPTSQTDSPPERHDAAYVYPRPTDTFVRPKDIGFFKSYFVFATKPDIICLVIAVVLTIVEAFLVLLLPTLLFLRPSLSIARMPLPWYWFRNPGDIFQYFSDKGYYRLLVILAGVLVCLSGTRKWLLDTTRERMEERLKRNYLADVLACDQAWFDANNPLTVSASMATDARKVSKVLSKFHSVFLGGAKLVFMLLFVALLHWRLVFVALGTLGVIMTAMWVSVRTRTRAEDRKDSVYREANAVAEELLESARTVQACNGQDSEHLRYEAFLEMPEREDRRAIFWRNVSSGFIWAAAFAIPAWCWFALEPLISSDSRSVSCSQFFLVDKIPSFMTEFLGFTNAQATLLKKYVASLEPGNPQLSAAEVHQALTIYVLLLLALCWVVFHLITGLVSEISLASEFVQASAVAKLPMSRILDSRERAEKTRQARKHHAVWGLDEDGRPNPPERGVSSPDGRSSQSGVVLPGDHITTADVVLRGPPLSVRLEGVCFRYPAMPDRVVLDGISFEISPGDKVAIVGPSGCGKSTITQLLGRFYNPTEGAILVNGKTLNKIRIDDYARAFAWVPQEPVLFEGRLRENLVFGLKELFPDCPLPSDSEILDVCSHTLIKDVILQLPQGLDTPISGGNQFSGGQKQRLAIARALLRRPRLLLLDEATSALDYATEKAVAANLRSFCEKWGVTTVVVAHRLSTIRDADAIYVIDEGRLSERGTHDELLAKNGKYAALVELEIMFSAAVEVELGNGGGVVPEVSSSVAGGGGKGHDRGASPRGGTRKSTQLTARTSSQRSSARTESKHSCAIFEEGCVVEACINPDGSAREDQSNSPRPMCKIWALHEPWQKTFAFIVIGISFVRGFAQLFCFLVTTHYNSNLQNMFSMPTIADEKNWLTGCFLLVLLGGCLTMLLCEFARGFFSSHTQSALTKTLRSRVFRTLLRAEPAFFDDPKNRGGRLLTLLRNAASDLGNVLNSFFAGLIQGLSAFGIGVAYALWMHFPIASVGGVYTAVIMLVVFPLMTKSVKTDPNSRSNLAAASCASECLSNILGVRALPGAAQRFQGVFANHIRDHKISRVRAAPGQALLYGATYTLIVNIQTMLFLFLIPIFLGAAFGNYTAAVDALDTWLLGKPFGAQVDNEDALVQIMKQHALCEIQTAAAQQDCESWPTALTNLDPDFGETYDDAHSEFVRINVALHLMAFAGWFLYPSIVLLSNAGDGWAAAKDIFEVVEYRNQISIEEEEDTADTTTQQQGLLDFDEQMRLLDDQEQGCSQREAEEERRFTVREPIRSLKFDDVRFRYPTQPSTEILRGFALEIQAGTSVAFVGPSGGGKSTAVALLARFYDPSILLTNKLCYDNPTAGRVVVNGKYSLRDLPLRTWRGRIGYVGQEPVLFNISARDNILLGMQKDEVSEDDILRVAKLACIDFLSDDPADNSGDRLSWDEPLGLKAAKLSGGQKQRIAIARALIRKPQLLLLDEATSALDNRSEKEVQTAIDNIAANSKHLGLIIVTVAHRLSTVSGADKIVCVVDGRNVESGTHAELLAKRGYYYRLAQLVK